MTERTTRQRTAILQTIASHGRPLSPQEILASAREQVPALGIATVYRHLRLLLDASRIQAVTLPSDSPRYELARHDHHHHFQCRQCDRVFEVERCPGNLDRLAPDGFVVDGHELTLYGHCRDCGPKRRRRAPRPAGARASAILATATALTIAAALQAGTAAAAQPHAHGAARMDVAIEGSRLTLALESPLDDLVGFERAPRNDKERARIRTVARTLRDVQRHVVPDADAGCRAEATTLASDAIDPALLADESAPPSPAGPAAAAGAGDGHADLVVEYRFRCEAIERLGTIDVRLFDAFPGIKRIDVQVAGGKRQRSLRLTPKTRAIRL